MSAQWIQQQNGNLEARIGTTIYSIRQPKKAWLQNLGRLLVYRNDEKIGSGGDLDDAKDVAIIDHNKRLGPVKI